MARNNRPGKRSTQKLLKVLYLITARGGSKSVPGKNMRKIAGISLVGYKALSARKSKYCSRLIISTDSPEIQEDARTYGVEVPFTRPSELATDTASSFDVVAHAMDWAENESGEEFDALMLLEPSTPLASADDYDGAVELMIKQDASVVVGVRETEVNSVFVGPIEADGRIAGIVDQMKGIQNVRRQDLPQEFTLNGGLYLFRWEYFKEHPTIYHDREKTFGYVMDRYHSTEIDEVIDLEWVEFLVDRGYVDASHWKN